MRAVIIHGKHWSRIRDSNVLPGRSDAQIRERYTNCISLSSRGAFTPDEDKLIIQGVTEMGAQNWATIAKALKGRTDSQVAKRWKLIEEYVVVSCCCCFSTLVREPNVLSVCG